MRKSRFLVSSLFRFTFQSRRQLILAWIRDSRLFPRSRFFDGNRRYYSRCAIICGHRVQLRNAVESDLSLLRFGEDRARNKVRPIVTFQVAITEFKITHSGSADANEGWSVAPVFSGRATFEAGVDYRKGFARGDRHHGPWPPSSFTHADDPNPDESTWTKFADLLRFH